MSSCAGRVPTAISFTRRMNRKAFLDLASSMANLMSFSFTPFNASKYFVLGMDRRRRLGGDGGTTGTGTASAAGSGAFARDWAIHRALRPATIIANANNAAWILLI